jgi:hypothetical protein
MLNFRIRFSIFHQTKANNCLKEQRKSFVVSANENALRSNVKRKADWALRKKRISNVGGRALGMKIPRHWEEGFGDFF